MKNLLLIIGLIIGTFALEAKNENVPKEIQKKLNAALQNENSLGRRFVVAVSPNDDKAAFKQILNAFIASSEKAIVTITNPQTGAKVTKAIEPYTVLVVDADEGFDWPLEMWESEEVLDRGIVIESTKPISVYVINSKSVSTDGYLAIPVNAWGKEYRNISFYDFKESRNWASGFMIIAAEDGTRAEISLQGLAIDPNQETRGGHRIGDTWTVKLDKGQVYAVQGTGLTRGIWDMTGTKVSANKNIGLISFHQRTMIPKFVVNNGRDHLVEMPPPVQAWGTDYVTVELDRDRDKGDYFRVIASEDNTNVSVKWYNKLTGQQIGNWDFILEKAGDFNWYHPVDAEACFNTNINESIRGTSVFHADKPIFVMQYGYSACWDNADGNYDPLMFCVSSVQQFTKSTIFQTPSNGGVGNGTTEYTDNFMNLIVLGDEDPEKNYDLINSIKLDGKPMAAANNEIFGHKIPGTNMYWITIEPTIGPHVIEGDAPFGGYIYGFASFDSYGWPAATAYRNLGDLDTLAPVLTIDNECYTYKIKATELRDQEAGCDTCKAQIDTHIDQDPFILENINFKDWVIDPELEDEFWYQAEDGDSLFHFILEVEDPTKDATIVFAVTDKAGNIAYDTISYFADKLRIDPNIEFGLKRMYSQNKMMINFISDKAEPTEITEIRLAGTSEGAFFIDPDFPVAAFTFEALGQMEIPINYVPNREYLDAEEHGDGRYDLDSLIITTKCVEFKWPIRGQGGENYMNVQDWIRPKALKLDEKVNSQGVLYVSNYNTIRNRQATWPLEIYGMDVNKITDLNDANVQLAPYTLEDELVIDAQGDFTAGTITIPATPTKVDVDIELGVFSSNVDGLYTRNIPFKTNARAYEADIQDDTLSYWSMKVISSNADVSNENWSKTRLNKIVKAENAQVNGGYLILENLSDLTDPGASIYLYEIKFVDNNGAGTEQLVTKNPTSQKVGEFRILDTDPENPKWNSHIAGLTNGLANGIGIQILPINAPPQANAYSGSVKIPLQFTPMDEYADNLYETKKYVIEFDLLVNNVPTKRQSIVYGEAYLPKIKTADDVIPQNLAVTKNVKSNEILEIPVTNIGYNNELYIYGIENVNNINMQGIEDVEDFIFNAALSDFDPTTLTFANPLVLGVGETKYLRFNFKPLDDANALRTGNLTFRHSGDVEGIEPNQNPASDFTTINGTANLTAYVKVVGVNGTNLDLGPIIKCDTEAGVVSIFNTGSDPFVIESITDVNGLEITNIYPELKFSLNGVKITDFSTLVGTEVPANGQIDFDVVFVPELSANKTGSLNIRYKGSFNNPQTGGLYSPQDKSDITINYEHFTSDVILDITDNGNVETLGATTLLNKQDGSNLGVTLTVNKKTDYDGNQDRLSNMKIDYFEFVYEWRRDQIALLEENGVIKFEKGNNVSNWTVTAEKLPLVEREIQVCDDNSAMINMQFDRAKFTFTAPAGEFLQNEGMVVNPTFQMLISNCPKVTVDLISSMTNLGGKDLCVANTVEPGNAESDVCIDNYRGLSLTAGPKGKLDVDVTGTEIKINYNVPIAYDSDIQIIDMQGNVVSNPAKGYHKEGSYEITLPIADFSNGVHIVKYKSLEFEATEKIIITK